MILFSEQEQSHRAFTFFFGKHQSHNQTLCPYVNVGCFCVKSLALKRCLASQNLKTVIEHCNNNLNCKPVIIFSQITNQRTQFGVGESVSVCKQSHEWYETIFCKLHETNRSTKRKQQMTVNTLYNC